jgi:hypothetical protein
MEVFRAVDGVAEIGDVSKGGREYFDKMPPVFLEKFEETFAEHTKKWRSHGTLPVIIAGHPQIARAFIRWLLGSENDADADEEAELVHHYTGTTTPTINVKECINWLTRGITDEEKQKMEGSSLIQDLMEDLRDFVECEDDSVDMLEPSTWENTPYDFTHAEDLIWNAVAPRAAHQQRVENLVQTAGHLGKTNVEEARRSAHCKIHSLFYRDFSTWELAIERQSDKDKKLIKPNRRRVEGKKRLIMRARFTDALLDKMDAAETALNKRDPKIMRAIATEMNRSNKISTSDSDEKYKRFETAAKSAGMERAVTSKHLADVTAMMNGSIILSCLTQGKGANEYIAAELAQRKIKYYPSEDVNKMSKAELKRHKTGKWKDQSITHLKNVLKKAEHTRLVNATPKHVQPPKLSDVQNIVPFSDKMKEYIQLQWEVYKARKGQVHESAE